MRCNVVVVVVAVVVVVVDVVVIVVIVVNIFRINASLTRVFVSMSDHVTSHVVGN